MLVLHRADGFSRPLSSPLLPSPPQGLRVHVTWTVEDTTAIFAAVTGIARGYLHGRPRKRAAAVSIKKEAQSVLFQAMQLAGAAGDACAIHEMSSCRIRRGLWMLHATEFENRPAWSPLFRRYEHTEDEAAASMARRNRLCAAEAARVRLAEALINEEELPSYNSDCARAGSRI